MRRQVWAHRASECKLLGPVGHSRMHTQVYHTCGTSCISAFASPRASKHACHMARQGGWRPPRPRAAAKGFAASTSLKKMSQRGFEPLRYLYQTMPYRYPILLKSSPLDHSGTVTGVESRKTTNPFP